MGALRWLGIAGGEGVRPAALAWWLGLGLTCAVPWRAGVWVAAVVLVALGLAASFGEWLRLRIEAERVIARHHEQELAARKGYVANLTQSVVELEARLRKLEREGKDATLGEAMTRGKRPA
jgi:hypothetical protein